MLLLAIKYARASMKTKHLPSTSHRNAADGLAREPQTPFPLRGDTSSMTNSHCARVADIVKVDISIREIVYREAPENLGGSNMYRSQFGLLNLFVMDQEVPRSTRK